MRVIKSTQADLEVPNLAGELPFQQCFTAFTMVFLIMDISGIIHLCRHPVSAMITGV
jgi:hypothetical protein